MKMSYKRGDDEASEAGELPAQRNEWRTLLVLHSRRVKSLWPCPQKDRTHTAGKLLNRATPRPPRLPTHSVIYDRSVFIYKTDTVSADKY